MPTMALTLWQPYATLLAGHPDLKRCETRSWPLPAAYVGRLGRLRPRPARLTRSAPRPSAAAGAVPRTAGLLAPARAPGGGAKPPARAAANPRRWWKCASYALVFGQLRGIFRSIKRHKCAKNDIFIFAFARIFRTPDPAPRLASRPAAPDFPDLHFKRTPTGTDLAFELCGDRRKPCRRSSGSPPALDQLAVSEPSGDSRAGRCPHQ